MYPEDNELVYYICENDDNAYELGIKKYRHIVFKVMTDLKEIIAVMHLDKEDLEQEGYLVIFKSIGKYNGKTKISTYLYKCIKNRFLEIINFNQAAKRVSNTKTVSLDQKEIGSNLIEKIPAKEISVYDLIDSEETYFFFQRHLSFIESSLYDLVSFNLTKEEIIKVLDINIKMYYNHIYRLRVKLKKLVRSAL